MLYIGFVIRNPFSRRHEMVTTKTVQVSKNKSFEVGIYRNNSIVGGSVGITGFKQNHAGFSFDIELLGWDLDFTFYDHRHYDETT